MKYTRIVGSEVYHVHPRHSSTTLCGYRVDGPNMMPNVMPVGAMCKNCEESIEELQKVEIER